MRVRNIILTIAAAALIAVPLTLVAQGVPGGGNGQGPGGGPGSGAWGHGPGGGGFGGGPGDGLGMFDRMLPRLAERLGLTDEQLEEIRTILDEAQPLIADLSDQLEAGRAAYREANPDPTVFDEGAFRTHAAEQAGIQIELMVLTQSTRARALSLLTPEQLTQLEELRNDHSKRFTRRSGGRRTQ